MILAAEAVPLIHGGGGEGVSNGSESRGNEAAPQERKWKISRRV